MYMIVVLYIVLREASVSLTLFTYTREINGFQCKRNLVLLLKRGIKLLLSGMLCGSLAYLETFLIYEYLYKE